MEVIIQLGKILKKSGSLLPTKILMDVYYRTKGKLSEESPEFERKSRTNPATFCEMIGKYLNIMQIYINGKAYITSNTECDPQTLIETISNSIDETCILNCRVERNYNTCIQRH